MKYKRASNSGPVPYPDQSGRMLTDEIVEGPEWSGLVSLGFVVPVVDDIVAGKHFPEPARVAPVQKSSVSAPGPAPVSLVASVRQSKVDPGQRQDRPKVGRPRKNTAESAKSESYMKNDIVDDRSSKSSEGINVVIERNGTDGVDSAEAGGAGAEGPSGRGEAP